MEPKIKEMHNFWFHPWNQPFMKLLNYRENWRENDRENWREDRRENDRVSIRDNFKN
jgi:hypothetical protein